MILEHGQLEQSGIIASIDAIPKHGTNRHSREVSPTSRNERDIKYWTARAKRDNCEY